jgi:hypothetical protein
MHGTPLRVRLDPLVGAKDNLAVNHIVVRHLSRLEQRGK